MEATLQQLHPEATTSEDNNLSNVSASSAKTDLQAESRDPSRLNKEHPIYGFQLAPRMTSTDEDLYASSESEDGGDPETQGVAEWLQMLHLKGPGGYRGKSSGTSLVKSVFELREEILGGNGDISQSSDRSAVRNLETWPDVPWEYPFTSAQRRPVANSRAIFPDQDLLGVLIGNYFYFNNGAFPLLNEVLFKRQIAEGLHFLDENFSVIVLLVAALGSRGCDDPRVYLDSNHAHSRGWKWFNQAQLMRRPLVASPSLYDLQAVVLTTSFLHSSSSPEAGWSLLGSGVRLTMDVGAHRRKSYGSKPTIYSEQWKRAFWVLISLDRHISSKFGKPSAIRDEDFDLDLPIECDDEYWFSSDPELAFKQPEGKPCFISGFIHSIKYFRLVDFVMRTLYTPNKSKTFMGLIGPESKQRLVIQCDSTLNEWRESIPEHIRWDPEREDDRFFHQSAMLQELYYQGKILIHRPFIMPVKTLPIVTTDSLDICTNAARSISAMLKAEYRRTKAPFSWQIMPAFISGITILLHMWACKKNGITDNLSEDMESVRTCMQTLKLGEKGWHVAGQHWDTLYVLSSLDKLPMIQEPSPIPGTIFGDESLESSLDPSPMVPTPRGTPKKGRNRTVDNLTNTAYPTRNLTVFNDHAVPLAASLLEAYSLDHPQPLPAFSSVEFIPGSATFGPLTQPAADGSNGFPLLDDFDESSFWLFAPDNFGLGDWNSYINEISGTDTRLHSSEERN